MACEVHPSETFGTIIICNLGQRTRRTWDCECGHKNPREVKVCQSKKCGLCRDGCPLCDSDILPAKTEPGLFEPTAPPFTPGVPRLHRCSGDARENKLPCGYEVTA